MRLSGAGIGLLARSVVWFWPAPAPSARGRRAGRVSTVRGEPRRGSPGPQTVLRHRPHPLRGLQLHPAPGQTCTDPSPVLRHYTTFTQASDENGLSRILVGFHFRKAVTAGITHGTKIGAWTVNRSLQPVH